MHTEEVNLKNLINYVNGKSSNIENFNKILSLSVIGLLMVNPEIGAAVSTVYTLGGESNKSLISIDSFNQFFNKKSKELEAIEENNKCKIANLILAKLALKDTIFKDLEGVERNRANWKLKLKNNSQYEKLEEKEKKSLETSINVEFTAESYLDELISFVFETVDLDDSSKDFIANSKERLRAYKNKMSSESSIYKIFVHDYYKKEQNDYKNLYITINEFEKRLIKHTDPSINLDFFNYRDDSFSESLKDNLNSKALYVKSREREESIYYILYLLKNKYPEEIKRTLIVESIEDWNKLEGKVQGKLLIPNFNSSEIKMITNNTCIFSYGSFDFISPRISPIKLSPRILRDMVDDLTTVIDDHSLAYQTIKKTNGLFSSFKRSVFHGKLVPLWSNIENKRLLIPALLIGQWQNYNEDKELLEVLAGQEFEKYIANLNNLIRKEDPFLLEYLNKSKYKLTNIDEAWEILKDDISKNDLENFEFILLSIFSEVPEKFKLPQDQWIMAPLLNKDSQYSPTLKKGVVQSLIKLSDINDKKSFVDNIITDIFKEINSREKWFNISGYLPDLMEASPGVVLAVLKKEVEILDSPLWSLFTEQSKDYYSGGGNYYTSVLWALEIALAFEAFAIDSLRILVKLAERNIVYKISNSPLNTLYSVLSAWHPTNNISIENKIKFVEKLIKNESPISQDILNSILPDRNHHQSFSSINTPTLKSYEMKILNITHKDLMNTYKEYTRIAIENAKLDLDKWLLILEKATFFDFGFEKEVFEGIQNSISLLKTDKAKYVFKEKIRKIICDNRKYPTAIWALPEPKVELIEQRIFNKIIYENKVYDILYLFNNNYPHFLKPTLFESEIKEDYYQRKLKLKKIRIETILSFFNDNKKLTIDDLISFFKNLKVEDSSTKRDIGEIFGELVEEDNEVRSLLNEFIKIKESDVIEGIISFKAWSSGNLPFVYEVLSSSIPNYYKLCILKVIPFNQDMIKFIEDLDTSQSSEFWKSFHFTSIKNSGVEKIYVWENLLKYGNFMNSYRILMEDFQIFTAIELLKAIRKNYESPTPDYINNYFIKDIFNKIYENDNLVGDHENIITNLEWFFFHILTDVHNNCEPRYIKKSFTTNPSLLSELIKYSFKSDDNTDVKAENNFLAENAYRILMKLKICPCEKEKGKIDKDELLKWVESYHEIILNNHQLAIGMQKLGECFAYSPFGTDGIFPHESVREVFEIYDGDDNLKRGFSVGIYNKRGIYSSSAGNGELHLSNQYEKYSKATKINYPNISKVLLSISESYKRESELERERTENDL